MNIKPLPMAVLFALAELQGHDWRNMRPVLHLTEGLVLV